MRFIADQDLMKEHQDWLLAFDPQHKRNWEKLLNADAEAGMCEAAVRHLLQDYGNNVAPNEDVTGSRQSPDFHCTNKDKVFYVEVTCISIGKATEVTTLPPHPKSTQGAQSYRNLNGTLFGAVKQKTPQCAGLDAPALVAVGTFHFQASCICFHRRHLEMLLTGDELITQNINITTGAPVGDMHLSTKLRSATFLWPNASTGLSHARKPLCFAPRARQFTKPSCAANLFPSGATAKSSGSARKKLNCLGAVKNMRNPKAVETAQVGATGRNGVCPCHAKGNHASQPSRRARIGASADSAEARRI